MLEEYPKSDHYDMEIRGWTKYWNLVCLTKQQLLNPSANICTGIRWLFRKKETAADKLKHKATWINTIEDYKSYLKDIIENKPYNEEQMKKLNHYYKLLQENNNESKNPVPYLVLEPVGGEMLF